MDNSINDRKYIIGKDGWFFLSNDTNRVMDQIQGNYELGSGFDKAWQALFHHRATSMKELGITYSFLVAPNKECVYPQFLPDGIELSELRPVFRFLRQVPDDVDVLYPLQELRAASVSTNVYPKGDSHWSLPGALVAYRQLAKKLGIRAVQDDEIDFYIDPRGDLSSKVNEKTEYIRGRIREPTFRLVSNNNVPNTGHKVVYENADKTLPSCVMFRDSYGTILLDILAQSFSRFVAVWQPNIDYTILRDERPDIAISVMAERFLAGVPNDLTGKSHQDYLREKGFQP